MTLFVLIEAGYVDLFKDANFENKLTRVDDIVLDVCYTFKCKNSGSRVDNSITSAKWHGLPEKGQYFGENEDTTITFYVDLDCEGDDKSWLIKTQITKKLYFPENFRLDGMNDAISSFKVNNAGGVAGVLYVCAATENTTVTNDTSTAASSASA
ncbi:hypothetical protein V7S43_005765 [Phytophthora oleae]|uniref:Uncharacterized protein n=1 Tax=Phytophthora oleae TaxID=2107226 RepID=A0ABD3FUU3_9STRA